jgi:hypothetical protein
LRAAFFITFGAETRDWIEFLTLTLLSRFPPGSELLYRIPDPRKHHSLTSSQGSSSTPACLQPPSTMGQSSLKVLSPSVSSPCTLSCGLSLISLKTLVLGHSSLSSWEPGSPLGTVEPLWSRRSLWGLFSTFLSLSPEDLIFQGCLQYLSSGQAFTMGVGLSQIPSDSPTGCLLANLGPLSLMPDFKL